jgi:membrane protein
VEAERAAGAPAPRVLASLRRAGREFLADDCTGLAQQVAFGALLAFFPSVVALAALLGLIDAYDELQRFLDPVAPGAVIDLLGSVAADSGGGSALALALGVAGALWASSGAMGTLVKSINRAWDCDETRPFWKLRLISLLLVLVAALAIAGVLLLIVVGGTLGDAIASRAGLGGAFDWTWNLARWPVAFAGVVALLSLVYRVAPNRPSHGGYVTVGALVGSLLWLLLSGLFSLYTSFSDSYTKTYGTLAGGIVLLLWLNYSALAVLFGAELDSELERRRRSG